MPSTRRKRESGYREELRDVLADMLGDRSDTRAGDVRLSGVLRAGKLVACVYVSGVGIRVPAEDASRIRGAPTGSFEPYGRPMRAWSFLEPTVAGDLVAKPPCWRRRSPGRSGTARRSSGWAHRAVADGRRAGAC